MIADSAYPAQSAEGVETVVTGADQFEVLQAVVRALDASKHVRPNFYMDRELAAIAESDAPGISAYRDQLSAYVNTLQLTTPPVQTLPYTSVFVQLDCAYWSPEAERRLRSVLAAQSGR